MLVYQFHIDGLRSDTPSGPYLVLRTATADGELRVRLTLADVQDLAVALASAPAAPTRLARLIADLAQQLDATLSHVQLTRGVGNMVEALLVLTSAHMRSCIPVTFGDGMTLAIANHLPIHGNESITPLLKLASSADVPLPAVLTAFLNALPEV